MTMTWDTLAVGEGCPFDAPRADNTEHWDLVAQLPVSSWYLPQNQMYRGHGILVFDPRHVTRIDALTPAELRHAEHRRRTRLVEAARHVPAQGMGAELVLAADQFIITPACRIEEAARARAMGDEVRTVIAGYHWFTDWGRDTMISLEGLALCTGR